MDKRTLIIVAALAFPVVVLAIVAQSGGSAPKNAAPAPARIAAPAPRPQLQTLEQARTDTRNRLAVLEKMTPAQWPEERKRNPRVPPTLEQALQYNNYRLTQLNAMTQQQWEASKGKIVPVAPQQANKKLPSLTPKQQSPAAR